MKTEDTPEIIEIIDDDIDAFGERSASTTMVDSGGPRWIGPVAGLALIAIIGYGVASSASTSSVPRVAPAPSTTIGGPTTTHPAPTTTEVPKPLVPFYAAQPPRQLTIEYAEMMTPSDGYYVPGSYQLWATDGATASSGSWFSVLTYPATVSNVFAIDAYRVQTDRMSMAISHLSGGQTSAQLALNDSSSVSLLSFGLTDDAVIRLASSLDVVRSHLQFTDRAVVEGYQLVSTVQPIVALQGNPAEQIFYSDGNDPVGGFGILVSPRAAGADGSTLERQNALQFFLDNPTTFDVDGH
ncbi:MAG TPA: hypothetical protein VHQ23_04565, partial [Ilumatobacteraceae bacterium]|nr:hypothetical protein [Ilumatobacteraceae bacterium]